MEVLKQEREARKQALLAQKQRLEAELAAIQEREAAKAAQFKKSDTNKQEDKKKRKRNKDLSEKFAMPDSDEEDMADDEEIGNSASAKSPKKKRKTKRKKNAKGPVAPTESINGIRSAAKDFLNEHRHCVYFKNVSFEMDEQELAAFFADCGLITKIFRVINTSGKFIGIGYVAFGSNEGVARALAKTKSACGDRTIVIELPRATQQRDAKK